MLSHWLDEAPLAAEDEAPTLHGTTRADVCIVGGGFCGLWTAIRLKERDPALDIVIVDKKLLRRRRKRAEWWVCSNRLAQEILRQRRSGSPCSGLGLYHAGDGGFLRRQRDRFWVAP